MRLHVGWTSVVCVLGCLALLDVRADTDIPQPDVRILSTPVVLVTTTVEIAAPIASSDIPKPDLPEVVIPGEASNCIREGCNFFNSTFRLFRNSSRVLDLQDVEFFDIIKYNITQSCFDSVQPCRGASVLLLDDDNFAAFRTQQPFKVEKGTSEPTINATTTLSPILVDYTVLNNYKNLHIVIFNNETLNDQALFVSFDIYYKGSPCLVTFIWLAVAIALVGFTISLFVRIQQQKYGANAVSIRSSRPSRAPPGGSIHADANENDMDGVEYGDCCVFCEYAADENKLQRNSYAWCCCCFLYFVDCRLPKMDCCNCGLYSFYEKPMTSYSYWWRSMNRFTWPWNPLREESVLFFRDRVMFLVVSTLFNVLQLTLLSGYLAEYNAVFTDISSNIPVAGYYLATYLGTSFVQFLFAIAFKPLLVYVRHTSPWCRRNAVSETAKCLFWALENLLEGIMILICVAILYYGLQLTVSYRCSVLIYNVAVPFFINQFFYTFLAWGLIPFPVLYVWLHLVGCEVDAPASNSSRADNNVEDPTVYVHFNGDETDYHYQADHDENESETHDVKLTKVTKLSDI